MTMNLLLTRLLLAVLLMTGIHTYATHLIGGEMSYEHLGNNNYLIRLKVYRDCGPDNTMGTGFDASAAVGIYENGTLLQTLQLSSLDAVITLLPNDNGDPCLNIPSDLCNEEAVYTTTVNLDFNTTGYDIVYQRCCRSPSIINLDMPGDQGATYWAHIPGSTEVSVQNSSPTFTNLPPSLLCANTNFSMDHSATELDGDDLVYSICNPYIGADPFDPQPITPLPPPYINVTWNGGFSFDDPITAAPAFAIDSNTGELTGTPTIPGKYVMGVCVREYRDGVLIATIIRDFMFNVVTCSPEVVAAVIPQEEPCQGMTIQFDNDSFNADEWIWDFGVDGTEDDISFEENPIFTFPDTGVYVITLIAGPNLPCADTTQIEFTAYDLVSSDLTIGEGFCAGGGIGFDMQGSGVFSNNAEFEWEFGADTEPESTDLLDPGVIIFLDVGTFPVTFTVLDGACISQSTQNVTVDPFPIAGIGPQNDPCSGLTVDFTNTSQFSSSWLWDFGIDGTADQSTEENPSYTYPDYGTYTVVLTADPNTACEHTITMDIVVSPENPVDLAFLVGNADPCEDSTLVELTFIGSGADVITWDMGDGTILTGSPTEHVYDEEGEYTITLVGYNELCDVDDQLDFDLYFETEAIQVPVQMPNVFTPNGDGKNERFRPFFYNEEEIVPESNTVFDYLGEYNMKIYDRWGVLLFDSDNGTLAWDGKYDGNLVSEGTYYYIVTYTEQCIGDPLTIDGAFSVLSK